VKKFRVPLLALFLFAADQLSKAWVVGRLALHDVETFCPFFSLVHVQNTGAAFGILQDSNLFFIGITVLVLFLLTMAYDRFLGHGTLTEIGLGFLWGGALGNLMDRLLRGGVVDFLDFHWGAWHWPAFNVADAAICTGVFFLAISSFRPSSAPAS